MGMTWIFYEEIVPRSLFPAAVRPRTFWYTPGKGCHRLLNWQIQITWISWVGQSTRQTGRRLCVSLKSLPRVFFFLSLFEPNSDYRPCHDNIHCLFENRGCSSVDCYSNWFIIPLLPSAKGTQFCSKWGPNFEWDGDLMQTFASTNGDPKCDFLKIYLNKLIYWNTKEENYGKTPLQNVASSGVQVKTSFAITSIQIVNI